MLLVRGYIYRMSKNIRKFVFLVEKKRRYLNKYRGCYYKNYPKLAKSEIESLFNFFSICI